MKPSPAVRLLAVTFLSLVWISLAAPEARCGTPLRVSVSIDPQRYFVEKIGGERIDVSVMVPKGASPETFEPSPRSMRRLSDSALYLAVGVPFERAWMNKFREAAPRMALVRTDDGIHKIPMSGHHGHGAHAHKHDHGGGPDPHVWLSPPLVMLQARNILAALLIADPSNRETYHARYRGFIAELVELDLKIQGLFAENPGNRRFMVYHPAWGYFAKAYGLEQIPVEQEGKEPTAKELTRLMDLAKGIEVKVIFTQTQFPSKSARLIAEAVGARIVVADPLAEDWAANLRDVSRQFVDALR